MAAVSFKQVSKCFGKTLAVNDISLEIEEGEFFCILGPSGCGKTTLLRMVAGFCRPDRGDILINGKSILPTPPHLRNVSMVFQNYALWPHMTVLQNVLFGLEMHAVPKAERMVAARQALERVKMGDLGKRLPGELSGGQQQRVALARALALKPAVLLFDEPLSNLDSRLRQELREEIMRLHSELRCTTIYVTHDQVEALTSANRIAVLRDGAICQVGGPKEIYSAPRSRFVADFLGAANILKATIEEAMHGEVKLKTNVGLLRMQSRLPLVMGEEIAVCVRPEAITLDTRCSSDCPVDNQVPVVLKESQFLGSTCRLLLEHASGQQLSALLLNPQSSIFSQGQRLHAVLNDDNLVILKG